MYSTTYLIAELTVPQLTVAPLVVILVEDNEPGVVQGVNVVNVDCVELLLSALQMVFTCQV